MIVDQGLLGVAQRAFYGLQLLRNVDARAPFFDHRNDRAQMPFGTFQPCDDFRVACMMMRFCHMNLVTSPRGYGKLRKGAVMARRWITDWTVRMTALLCILALLVSSAVTLYGHAPKVMQVLQEHTQMIEEHGHSHGLEDDLAWAMHGHSHEKLDHDHSQAVLVQHRALAGPSSVSTTWHAPAVSEWSVPVFRLERPPRA